MHVEAVCPLCGCLTSGPSWFGDTTFRGHRFSYRECGGCGSLFCHPMPHSAVIATMYDASYAAQEGLPVLVPSMERTHRWLAARRPGRFLDFGCGSGALVVAASHLGWDAEGVEFDPAVVARIAAATGCLILTRGSALTDPQPTYDVINLGDVLEHLTDPLAELGLILQLLRPGGHLLAQGPLEANDRLFLCAMRWARTLRRRASAASIPPYHVTLATAQGQRCLFERARLQEVNFIVSEVAWPAPAAIDSSVVVDPRALALFAVRVASRIVSRHVPAAWEWGNRYLYDGVRA